MTSSNTLKKIVSIGASLMLAIGGSLASATPANAATRPGSITPANITTGSGTAGSAATFTATGTTKTYWLICDVHTINDLSGTTTEWSEITDGTCGFALHGSTMADAITATTINLADVDNVWLGSAAVDATGSWKTNKWLIRYEAKVDGSNSLLEWSISDPAAIQSTVLTDPGVSGTPTPSGTLSLGGNKIWSDLDWNSLPVSSASVKYQLVQCDAIRNAGSVGGEFYSAPGCQAYTAGGQSAVDYTSLPITLPAANMMTGLTEGKYIAISISAKDNYNIFRTIYVTSSTTVAYTAVTPPSISGQPTLTSGSSSLTATSASTTGSGIMSGWAACDTVRASAANATGSAALTALNSPTNDCVKIYSSSTHSAYTSTTISSSGSFENSIGQALNISGKNIVFYQEYSSGSAGYAYSASSTFGSGSGSGSGNTSGQAAFSGTASVGSTLTVTGGFDSMMGRWVICSAPKPAGNYTGGCSSIRFATVGAVETGSTITLQATYYSGGVGVGVVGKYVTYVGSNNFNATAVLVSAASVTPPPAAEEPEVVDPNAPIEAKPLPVWADSVVKSIPTLSKTLGLEGGKVSIAAGLEGLKSITIGGVAAPYTVASSGEVVIPVQAGPAGKTADIVITFDGGILTVQEGIKYVAPLDIAKVIERPVAIAAGSKKLTEAAADQIRLAAFANLKNTAVQCVAYASSNSSAAKATAKAIASQACGLASSANPQLKVASVSVVVNKAKAKKSALGIKVYKQN